MLLPQCLHSAGMVCCDLKPSNVLMDEDGMVKLGGFGLSRKLSACAKAATSLPVSRLLAPICDHCSQGQLCLPCILVLPDELQCHLYYGDIGGCCVHWVQAQQGTPAYTAPELVSKAGQYSTASDLWALGCVLYECAAGRPPFVAPSAKHLAHSIVHEAVPILSGIAYTCRKECSGTPSPRARTETHMACHAGVSPELADLVGRLLDKNPATRLCWADLRRHPFWKVCTEWAVLEEGESHLRT